MPTFRKDLHLGHDVATIDTDDIVNGAITEEKMADDSVSTRTLQDECVTEPKLADDAVSTRTIQDEAVTEPKLADDSVSHRTIQDNAVEGNNIKPGSIGNEHLKPDAVQTRNIKDKSVTPSKRSDDFDAKVVLPYVNPVDNKYKTITDELYSMIASLQVGGIALSGKFGQRTDIGIHQKALTKAFGYLWDKIGEITGEDYMNFELSVVPAASYSESPATFTITADSSEAISDFDSIKIYVDDVLVAESGDVEVFTTSATIDETAEVKAVGVILGRTIVKTASAVKEPPFFMGSGLVYTDVINVDCLRQLDGTIEGNYDVTVNNDGDYIFIIIPISHKDEFRRADMNGYEIPVDVTEMEEFVVYQSQNVYNAGTYNVDIDINS